MVIAHIDVELVQVRHLMNAKDKQKHKYPYEEEDEEDKEDESESDWRCHSSWHILPFFPFIGT